MTGAPENRFKARLLAGEVQIGLWMSIPSAVTAEALSCLGYDWLLFDTEHTALEVAQVQPLLQAAASGGSALLSRPAWNDKVLIKKMLDIGVQTLLIPFVQSGDEARAAVEAMRYPPAGIRGVAGGTRAAGFGTRPDYLKTANDEICTLVQIETAQAMERLDDIAGTDGIDGVFIGPADLSASMGLLGIPGADEVQAVLKAAPARIRAAGAVPGILATTQEDAARYIGWGYGFVAVAIDLGLLVKAARDSLAAARSA